MAAMLVSISGNVVTIFLTSQVWYIFACGIVSDLINNPIKNNAEIIS